MHEPPSGVADGDVLALVRTQWSARADRVEYLAVGFGAHHWTAYADDTPRLFVTLDTPGAGAAGTGRDARSLESAYSGAARLAASGLEFVVPCLAARSGRCTVPLADGVLTATGWIDGDRPPDASGVLPLVQRLHTADPPPDIQRWRPLVPVDFAADLARRLLEPWAAGPHAATAQTALTDARAAIARWVAAYHRLAEAAGTRPWVATHGEPHERNQLLTAGGLRLVDWESLRLAPAERDLRWLDPSGGDQLMVELFDLEWRLDQIAQYADWFEGPHGGGDDDREALAGLLEELARA